MKLIEKVKAQKLLSKMESGDFDENDVDNIFMRLRGYSYGHRVFKEVADFVAHNDERDRGVTVESMEAFYLSFRFFLEFTSPKRALDIASPFPLYVKKLMIYQVDKCKEEDLRNRFNVSRQRLKSRLSGLFKEDKRNRTAHMKKTLSKDMLYIIKHLLSFIGSQPAFDQAQVITELLAVVKANKLSVNEQAILEHEGKITLCVMLLLHDACFEYGAHKKGSCKISCEQNSISYNQRFMDENGVAIDRVESFGTLQVLGTVVLQREGKDLAVSYPLMSTTLRAEDWCDKSMFFVGPMSEDHPTFLQRKIDFEVGLCLTAQNKLGLIQG